MRRFLSEVLKFSLVLIVGTLILVFGTTHIERRFTSFEVPGTKTILVVGDSKLETAVNDEILAEAYNFSQSGTAYYYSFLKVRKMLQDNPQIHTLVVGYSYGDLAQEKDEWFQGEKYIKGKVRDHLFLMDYQDFFAIFQANPLDVLVSLFPIRAAVPLSNPDLGRWGGYIYLERDKLEEAKQRIAESPDDGILTYSRYQEEYLLKVYETAMDYDLRFILLTPPIHPLLEENQTKYKVHYSSFVEENMPNAILINHSSYPIPDFGFGDLAHLNYRGASLYSSYLSQESIFEP